MGSGCQNSEDAHADFSLSPLQVSDSPPGEDDFEGSAAGDLSGAGSGGGSGWGSGAGEEAEGDEDENMVYYFLEESTGYMEPALWFLSLLHTLVAFLCIIGYNCLKVGCHTGPWGPSGWFPVGGALVPGGWHAGQDRGWSSTLSSGLGSSAKGMDVGHGRGVRSWATHPCMDCRCGHTISE